MILYAAFSAGVILHGQMLTARGAAVQEAVSECMHGDVAVNLSTLQEHPRASLYNDGCGVA